MARAHGAPAQMALARDVYSTTPAGGASGRSRSLPRFDLDGAQEPAPVTALGMPLVRALVLNAALRGQPVLRREPLHMDLRVAASRTDSAEARRAGGSPGSQDEALAARQLTMFDHTLHVAEKARIVAQRPVVQARM